jgi:hypothetical protein
LDAHLPDSIMETSLDQPVFDNQRALQLDDVPRQRVTFNNCLFQRNQAGPEGPLTFYGLIYARSSLVDVVVNNSIFIDNVFEGSAVLVRQYILEPSLQSSGALSRARYCNAYNLSCLTCFRMVSIHIYRATATLFRLWPTAPLKFTTAALLATVLSVGASYCSIRKTRSWARATTMERQTATLNVNLSVPGVVVAETALASSLAALLAWLTSTRHWSSRA